MNNYHKDNQLFFREVARGVTEELEKHQVVQLAAICDNCNIVTDNGQIALY